MPLKFGLNAWEDYYPRQNANAPVVLCFGDSWFYYSWPGIGNLSHRFLDFERTQSIDIVAIGEEGMEIVYPGRRLLDNLSTFLHWERKVLDMICVSGGGNDFAGADDLDPLLQKGNHKDASTWFKVKETDDLFDNIKHGYSRIIDLRDHLCPNVPIVTHCYDYALPTGHGLLWFSAWIKPSLNNIGMPSHLHGEAIKYIIDRLADTQESLSDNEANFHFIDTRNQLTSIDWSNELHPTYEGFNKIAQMFYPVFKQYMPAWISKPKWWV